MGLLVGEYRGKVGRFRSAERVETGSDFLMQNFAIKKQQRAQSLILCTGDKPCPLWRDGSETPRFADRPYPWGAACREREYTCESNTHRPALYGSSNASNVSVRAPDREVSSILYP